MSRVILSAADADRLLCQLYKGRKPRHVHTLLCGCGARADLRQSPDAWTGWRILPFARCPGCRELCAQEADVFPLRAMVRFTRLVDLLMEEKQHEA